MCLNSAAEMADTKYTRYRLIQLISFHLFHYTCYKVVDLYYTEVELLQQWIHNFQPWYSVEWDYIRL